MDKKVQTGNPQQTFVMLECGSLDLVKIVQKGILLIGNTKQGKTTSGHYMMGSQLIGIENKAKSIIYGLKTGKNVSKIGEHQSNSETQIPNFFYFDRNQSVGIDCPGFLDSFGCLRIISNVYFIQKVFSIVKKIKFIIVVKYYNIVSTAAGLKSTFSSFLNMFRDVEKIIDQILPSINLLITQVPHEFDQKALIQKYRNSANIGISKFQAIYQKIKNYLVQNKRVYMIKAAKLGKCSDVQNKLLQQIDSNSQFWQRSLNEDNKINTERIRLSINQYMSQDTKKFLQELSLFSQFYQKKLIKNLQIFLIIIRQVIKSAQVDQPLKFFDKITKYLQQKQKNVKQLKKQYQDLYIKYVEKRKNAFNQIFNSSDNESSINFICSKDVPFSLMKIKAVKKLSEISQQIQKKHSKQREITTTKFKIKKIKQILSILIALSKRNSAQDQQKMQKFAYFIYKQNQLMNQIYEIFANSTKQVQNQTKEIQLMLFIYRDWPHRLDRTFHFFDTGEQPQKILFRYVQNLDIKNKEYNLNTYTYYIKFIQSLKLFIESKNEKEMQQIKLQKQYVIKTINKKLQQINLMALQYKIYHENEDRNQNIISNLNQQRIKIINLINRQQEQPLEDDDQQTYNTNLTNNIKVTQLIGQQVEKINKQYAIQVYESLNDAYQVLELHKLREINLMQNFNIKQYQSKVNLMKFCFQYAKKAYTYFRNQLAIEKAQKAYSLAQKLEDREYMMKIGKFLYKIYPSNIYPGDSQGQQDSIVDQDDIDLTDKRIKHAQAMNNGFFRVDLDPFLELKLKRLNKPSLQKIKSPKNSNKQQSPLKNRIQKN